MNCQSEMNIFQFIGLMTILGPIGLYLMALVILMLKTEWGRTRR